MNSWVDQFLFLKMVDIVGSSTKFFNEVDLTFNLKFQVPTNAKMSLKYIESCNISIKF